MLRLYFRAISSVCNKRTALWLLAGNAMFVLLSLLEPVFFREIIDVLVSFESEGERSFAPLAQVLGLWTAVGIMLLTVRGMVSLYADRLAHQSYQLLRKRYFEHVLALSLRFHGDMHSGKTLKNFTRGTEALFWTILGFYRMIFQDFLTIIFLLPFVLWLNWRLGLVMIGFVVLFMLIAIPVMIYANMRQMKIEDLYTKQSGQVGDALGNVAIVKSFTRISHEMERFGSLMHETLSRQMPLLNWWAVLTVLARIASTLIFISIFFVGSYLHFLNLASVGEIVMFVGFAALFLNSLESLLWQSIDVFWRFPGMKEYFEVMDTPVEVTDKPEAKTMPRVKGSVEFADVSFTHDGKKHALKHISFLAEPGKVIALVGQTGAGKSTIANLISRFFDVSDGAIRIDSTDIREVTQDSLRQNIGMVFQENLLFHDTILENIRVGRPDATETEVIEAAKQARAWEFIERLPDGLNTLVGERGVKLSGGERQRIAIARVILKNPPILVLDEATSALDAVTEKKLQDAFEILMKGRTTFIIAHRLSTIRKADTILVLEHGKIIERGSYSELVHKKGIFAEMVEAQTSGFLVET